MVFRLLSSPYYHWLAPNYYSFLLWPRTPPLSTSLLPPSFPAQPTLRTCHPHLSTFSRPEKYCRGFEDRPCSPPVYCLLPQLAHLSSPHSLSSVAVPPSFTLLAPCLVASGHKHVTPPSRHPQPQSSSHLLITGLGLSHPFASREFE